MCMEGTGISPYRTEACRVVSQHGFIVLGADSQVFCVPLVGDAAEEIQVSRVHSH